MINFFRKLFCQHDMELINQFDMKSEFDIITEKGLKPNTHNSITRKKVTDYRCKKCGKIKRLVVKTAR